MPSYGLFAESNPSGAFGSSAAWIYPGDADGDGLIEPIDLDNNGQLDLLKSYNPTALSSTVDLISLPALTTIWTGPVFPPNSQFAVAQMDADAPYEMVAAGFTSPTVRVFDLQTKGIQLSLTFTGASFVIPGGNADWTGDGIADLTVFVSYTSPSTHLDWRIYDIASGGALWNSSNSGGAVGYSANFVQLPDVDLDGLSEPLDLDSDGQRELLRLIQPTSFTAQVEIVSLAGLGVEWTGPTFWGSASVANLDNDVAYELIVANYSGGSGWVRVYDLQTHAIEFSQNYASVSSLSAAGGTDFDGDGKSDLSILATFVSSTTYISQLIYRGHAGWVLWNETNLAGMQGYSAYFVGFLDPDADGLPESYDLDQDGNKEWMIQYMPNTWTAKIKLVDATTLAVKWTSPDYGPNTNFSVADVDSDARFECIIGDTINKRVEVWDLGAGGTPTTTPTPGASTSTTTATSTFNPSSSVTPSVSSSSTRSATPAAGSSTFTPTRSATPSPSPVYSPTATRSATPYQSPSATPTSTIFISPTITPTATLSPWLSDTPSPTAQATALPGATPALHLIPNPFGAQCLIRVSANAPFNKVKLAVFTAGYTKLSESELAAGGQSSTQFYLIDSRAWPKGSLFFEASFESGGKTQHALAKGFHY